MKGYKNRLWISTCAPCGGKRMFPSRSNARESARRFSLRGLREYRCPHDPSMWHLGHLPKRVKAGRLTADEIFGQSAAAP